jgi:hypothetical protein
MFDVMFSAAARVARIVGRNPYSSRKRAQLPLSVSLMHSADSSFKPQKRPTLPGRLRDISATGLCMVVPTIRQGGYYFAGVDRMLEVAFEVASGPIQLHASPVRYERIEKDDGASVGYLIDAEITQMDDQDRVRLNEYLQTLR